MPAEPKTQKEINEEIAATYLRYDYAQTEGLLAGNFLLKAIGRADATGIRTHAMPYSATYNHSTKLVTLHYGAQKYNPMAAPLYAKYWEQRFAVVLHHETQNVVRLVAFESPSNKDCYFSGPACDRLDFTYTHRALTEREQQTLTKEHLEAWKKLSAEERKTYYAETYTAYEKNQRVHHSHRHGDGWREFKYAKGRIRTMKQKDADHKLTAKGAWVVVAKENAKAGHYEGRGSVSTLHPFKAALCCQGVKMFRVTHYKTGSATSYTLYNTAEDCLRPPAPATPPATEPCTFASAVAIPAAAKTEEALTATVS